MDQVKCIECGRAVANWPIWLSNTSVGVRCARCAGSGSNVVNAPKEQSTIVSLTNPTAAEGVEAS